MDLLNTLRENLGDKLEYRKDLSPYLTMKMKTMAEYYFEPESIDDWMKALRIIDEFNIPYHVIGGGSNIAVMSDLIEGVVLKNSLRLFKIEHEADDYVDVTIGSGNPMSQLVSETIKRGWSGFEYQRGLPGTIGGAIYMNSKWTDPLSYVGDTLLIGTIIDREGEVRIESRDYFNFSYDYSKLQDTKEVFLQGVFRLMKHDVGELEQRAKQVQDYRHKTQPFGVATGGCFFQNISEKEQVKYSLPSRSAGYLIDEVGLKGVKVGGFQISNKHANFIENVGNGNASDLTKLVNKIKSKVLEKYKVRLKLEVQVI